MRPPHPLALILALASTLVLAIGCAQVAQILADEPPALEARGPGKVFTSVEAAAVDALTYAYLQAYYARNSELMRGGTIQTTEGGYSYGEIHVANPLNAHHVVYTLTARDVARFQIYPQVVSHDVNRANERPSRADRRSVSSTDPLHRPIYILHPSLTIREYRGEGYALVEVASLRRATQPVFFAGN